MNKHQIQKDFYTQMAEKKKENKFKQELKVPNHKRNNKVAMQVENKTEDKSFGTR